MTEDIVAPTRRRSWVTHHMVDRVVALMGAGVPLDEIAECLLSLGLQADRINEIIHGQNRRK